MVPNEVAGLVESIEAASPGQARLRSSIENMLGCEGR
jgi:hypothetical protein